ncbi:MAG: AAA-like domain-containing protein [Stigonema ocellatum SAG 48.90 = DSM 106950]|nr:AAA-like domain-containing protein [Stigonema ocellatum SAG 48.90 = DSM 106950]
MPRSLKVDQQYIAQVKAAVQRQGYPRQKDLAEDLGMSRDTVRKFLNGYAVDNLNFIEICERLLQDWNAIAATDVNTSNSQQTTLEPFADEPEVADFLDVERQSIEAMCYQTLCQPGALLRIRAPGLMGKTFLIARVLGKLRQEGYRTVCLNLQYAEQADLMNLNSFLRWFCISVGELVGYPNCLDKYWNDKIACKMNCFGYFQRYLLPQAESPFVICIDEVEQLFNHEVVGKEFLGLLRAWHETAKTIPIWRRLRLVVVHSTENYIQLNINESPFNVGVATELPEFTPQEVQILAQKYGLDWELAQVNQLMALVGGHPFLVKQACEYLQRYSHITLEELLQTAPTEAGIYANYLRRYWEILQRHQESLQALKTVLSAADKVRIEAKQSYWLSKLGLVKLVGNEVRMNCNLYRHYFSDRIS